MVGLFNYKNPSAECFRDEAPILCDLADSEWDTLISYMERKVYPAGARIVAAGQRDRALYLIVTGTVSVVVDTPKGPSQAAAIAEGSVFGERSFFDGEPRSASVVALDQVEVLCLRVESLEQLSAWHPRIALKLLLELGKVLSKRSRRTLAA